MVVEEGDLAGRKQRKGAQLWFAFLYHFSRPN